MKKTIVILSACLLVPVTGCENPSEALLSDGEQERLVTSISRDARFLRISGSVWVARDDFDYVEGAVNYSIKYDHDADICHVDMFTYGVISASIAEDPSVDLWSFEAAAVHAVGLGVLPRFEHAVAIPGRPGRAMLVLEFTVIGESIELYSMRLEGPVWNE